MNPSPTRKGWVLYIGELDMREIFLAVLVAPVIFVILWLVMAMF